MGIFEVTAMIISEMKKATVTPIIEYVAGGVITLLSCLIVTDHGQWRKTLRQGAEGRSSGRGEFTRTVSEGTIL